MTGYAPEEVQAAVEKLVLSSIRRPYDTLGVRRTDLSFNDIQQAAAGVFILYPNAPFYVLWLGVQRLGDSIAAEAKLIDQLLETIAATGLYVLPVEDVSALFNAKAALQELGTAAGGRAGVFSDITKAPAFQRYSDNIQQFLAGPGGNVKNKGAIVQTPQQARSAIPALLTQLEEAHASLLAKVTGIVGGIEDYNKVSLPAVVSSSVLSNAASLVGADAAALEALTPTDRLSLIRQTVLDVLATRAVVTTFGSFSGPSDYYTLDGLGRPFSDALRLAEPAVAVSTKGGGVAIIAGVSDQLTVAVDGGAPFSILLNPSVLAHLDGQAEDSTFVIADGTQAPVVGAAVLNNNKLKVKVDGVSFTATLTPSAPATPAVLTGTGDTTTAGWYGAAGALDTTVFNLVVDGTASYSVTFAAPADATAMLAQLNAVINATGAQHRAVASIAGIRLVLTSVNKGSPASLGVFDGTANAVLGFTANQGARGVFPTRTAEQVAVDIQAALPAGVVAEGYYAPLEYSGQFNIPAGVDQTWTIPVLGAADLVALGITPNRDSAHVLSGPNAGFYPITAVTPNTITVTGTTVLEALAVTEVGPSSRRVRIRCNAPATQLPLETTLQAYGDDPASLAGLSVLGFFTGLVSRCTRTTCDLVAADISSKTRAVVATSAPTNSLDSVPGRTEPLAPTRVTFAAAAALGTQAFVGTTLTMTVTALTKGGSTKVGHILVLRGGPQTGQWYTVTTINGSAAAGTHLLAVGDILVATGTLPGSPNSGVPLELGPAVAGNKYDVVNVIDGPNSGQYFVQSPGPTPLDVVLQQTLPLTFQGPVALDMVVSYGKLVLLLKSINKTTESQLLITGSGSILFFSTSSTSTRGFTPWFQLPAIPRGLQAGDILETYATDYKLPSARYAIQGVNGKVIQLSPSIPSQTSWQFTVQPPPFGRLRVGTMNDYGAVRLLLQAWLARPENQPLFFTNFNRLVNPLLVNTNPTAVQVGTALNSLKQFYSFLLAVQATASSAPVTQALDAILAEFTVEPVPTVAALLQSFLEKGSARAADLLLAGQFSLFFGLTVDGASYAGAFQEAARAVAMNDLPVRRINRAEAQSGQLIAQMQSPDYEYTAASINEGLQGEQVNPPGNFGEPSNFGKT